MAIAITGATSGIGLAIAAQFVREGRQVRLHGRGDPDRAEAARSRLETIAAGNVVDISAADLTTHEGAESLAAQWAQGPLTGLVLCAGPFRIAAWDALEPVEVRQLFHGNLLGPWTLLQRLLPRLRSVQGVITCVGQNRIQDLAPAPQWAAYNAAKAGLVVLVRTLAEVEGPHGVRVNLVNPGIIASTEFSPAFQERVAKAVPLGRTGSVEEVAALVRWLHSTEATYVSGAVLDVNGGLADSAGI